MIEARPCGAESETARVLRVEPEEVPEQRFPLLCAVLSWALPATGMLAGGWTAAMVLVAAGKTSDPTAVITCGVATAVAVFGGMCLFERLVGTPGAALGVGVTIQLIHAPFVEVDIIPGWSATAGWILTSIVTGALIWRIRTGSPGNSESTSRTSTPRSGDGWRRKPTCAFCGSTPRGSRWPRSRPPRPARSTRSRRPSVTPAAGFHGSSGRPARCRSR